MRTRMYGGVRGRKTKIGGKPTFVFLLLDFCGPNNGPQILAISPFISKVLMTFRLNIGVILT